LLQPKAYGSSLADSEAVKTMRQKALAWRCIGFS
jgi:hypothetical protein